MNDEKARQWYAQEAATENWSTRTLQRNISSQYYYRMLKTQSQDAVKREMQELTAEYQKKLEFIKSPVIAEFLGMQEDTSYLESDLEQSIINNLQKFLMELGKGYAFVARQQRIHTEKEDYFIDLVFYNYILKCFVLIDLKTKKITHQDVGQMDMYIRMYDERKKQPDDHPTIGIILCADTDSDIARYSIMNESDQLFASKYKLYLPTEEELRTEIETQKELFYLQHADKEGGRRMRFKFSIQPFQTDAVESVADVFAGQPYNDRFTYRRDVEVHRDIMNWSKSDEELTMGFAQRQGADRRSADPRERPADSDEEQHSRVRRSDTDQSWRVFARRGDGDGHGQDLRLHQDDVRAEQALRLEQVHRRGAVHRHPRGRAQEL